MWEGTSRCSRRSHSDANKPFREALARVLFHMNISTCWRDTKPAGKAGTHALPVHTKKWRVMKVDGSGQVSMEFLSPKAG